MYKPPFEIRRQIESNICKGLDDMVQETLSQYSIKVDPEELGKALAYDREQYNAGYKDGYQDALNKVKELLEESYEQNEED